MRFSSILALLGVLGLVGCAADSSDQIDDQGDGADEIKGAKKFHYEPAAPEVFWKPGCGVRPPDGHVCEMGLFITYTRQYIDLKVTEDFSFDKKSNTLTVKLDTWSTGSIHPMVAVGPQTERLEPPSGLVGMGMRFHVRVVDWKGKQLFKGEIYEVPAP
jgi:hypothetical protein